LIFDATSSVNIKLQQFGIFVTGNRPVFNSAIQLFGYNSLSLSDVIESLQNGHTSLAEQILSILKKSKKT
jgi:hypothetical protein